MAVPIHVPRINNNDDVVRLVSLSVQSGEKVEAGTVVGQVETDKAVVDVNAPGDGYVTGVAAAIGDTIAVGSVLMWLGATADEPAPAVESARAAAGHSSGRLSGKARLLLRKYGLDAAAVPASGDRLSAADVERHVAQRGLQPLAEAGETRSALASAPPDVEGRRVELRSDERGMLKTVCWSRDEAVPGYVEMEYDAAAWDAYAKAFAEQHRLMLPPMLALMAWKLTRLAGEQPQLNATIVGQQRHEYRVVNLGFTVQVAETLYLAVLRDAGGLDERQFVNAMGDVQKRANANRLTPAELTGATVSFSSMGRWKVSRHIPVLPPHSAIIVAHATSVSGAAVLGATYDHRVLSGFHAVNVLRRLAKPGLEKAK